MQQAKLLIYNALEEIYQSICDLYNLHLLCELKQTLWNSMKRPGDGFESIPEIIRCKNLHYGNVCVGISELLFLKKTYKPVVQQRK